MNYEIRQEWIGNGYVYAVYKVEEKYSNLSDRLNQRPKTKLETRITAFNNIETAKKYVDSRVTS